MAGPADAGSATALIPGDPDALVGCCAVDHHARVVGTVGPGFHRLGGC